jgi:hypothetical protein
MAMDKAPPRGITVKNKAANACGMMLPFRPACSIRTGDIRNDTVMVGGFGFSPWFWDKEREPSTHKLSFSMATVTGQQQQQQ